MRLEPAGVLEIVDRAVAILRRRPLLLVSTVAAGSAPLAMGCVLGVHLLRAGGSGLASLLAGAAALAALAVPRAVGWGAGTMALASLLEGEPAEPHVFLRRAARLAPSLLAGQASPFVWIMLGLLLQAGPPALAVFASNVEGNPFASLGLTIVASAAGTLAFVGVLVLVSRRLLALPVAALELAGAAAARRSRQLVLGQTVRAALLFWFHALVFATLWITLVLAVPFALWLVQVLTGVAMTGALGVFNPKDPTYVAFQGAAAFLVMEPVKCASWALFYKDCGARKEGADLRPRLLRWAASGRSGVAAARREAVGGRE